MINSRLETTETEYMIKFSKTQFDMDFIGSIFNFINEKLSIKEVSAAKNVKDGDFTNIGQDNYFSHLDEK